MSISAPRTLTEAKTALEEKMMEVLLILETQTGKALPIPNIEFKRLGLRHGYATPADGGCIVINSDALTELLWSHTLSITLPHEVCHHVAPLIYDSRYHGPDKGKGWSHGRAWQSCMVMIGLPPDRCSAMNEEHRNQLALRVVKRKYAYRCGCKTHFVTAIKHNRVQQGKYNYFRCSLCGGNLTYAGDKINA